MFHALKLNCVEMTNQNRPVDSLEESHEAFGSAASRRLWHFDGHIWTPLDASIAFSRLYVFAERFGRFWLSPRRIQSRASELRAVVEVHNISLQYWQQIKQFTFTLYNVFCTVH